MSKGARPLFYAGAERPGTLIFWRNKATSRACLLIREGFIDMCVGYTTLRRDGMNPHEQLISYGQLLRQGDGAHLTRVPDLASAGLPCSYIVS